LMESSAAPCAAACSSPDIAFTPLLQHSPRLTSHSTLTKKFRQLSNLTVSSFRASSQSLDGNILTYGMDDRMGLGAVYIQQHQNSAVITICWQDFHFITEC
jgi:hypothetical protein